MKYELSISHTNQEAQSSEQSFIMKGTSLLSVHSVTPARFQEEPRQWMNMEVWGSLVQYKF